MRSEETSYELPVQKNSTRHPSRKALQIRGLKAITHSLSQDVAPNARNSNDRHKDDQLADERHVRELLGREPKELLETHLPPHIFTTRIIIHQHDKSSLIVQYWIPVLLLFLGIKTQDFGYNWVFKPLKRMIATKDKRARTGVVDVERL